MSVVSALTNKTSRTSNLSILKKNTSLKSRLSQIVNTPTKVRFVLPHSKKVRQILQDYINNSDKRDYDSLICVIRDSELFDEDISSLLKEANDCISLLNKDLRLFVEALLNIKWLNSSENVVREYQTFLLNLVSAHNYHAKFVIDSLVYLFLEAPSQAEWPDGIPTDSDCIRCVKIHSLLNNLVNLVPMCKEILLQSIKTQFPYFKRPTHLHEYYLHNIIWVMEYVPTLKPDILHLIFSKLIIMDVNAPKEDIEKAWNEVDDDEMFLMDAEAGVKNTNIETAHPVAHTLDVCLNKIFDYFVNECHDLETSEINWDRTKNLYQDILAIFDSVILPTYNTHHVQFIVFIMCSFKTTLAEAFLNYLWKKVCNPNVPSVLRQAAVTYISSLLARATYVPLTMMKATLQEMAAWIHTYISNQDGLECINSDSRVHSVFFSVCQALFYTVAFRHKDLVNTKKNLVFLQSLNLGKIVTCRLNPLRVCPQPVVQNFAAVTRKYQLAYCYTIIEHNSRNVMPTIYQDEKGSVVMNTTVLDGFYPFDPFILHRSGKKIQLFYRDYTEFSPDEAATNCKEVKETELDDFLDNQEMSTPKSVHNFSYGASPGFKFKSN